jgi:uncharacterized membrane protein
MLAVGYLITRSPIYAAAIALVDTVTKLVRFRLENRPAPQGIATNYAKHLES